MADINSSKNLSIDEAQREVIAEFSDFDDWMDRYQLLIDLGNELGTLDEKYKTEQNIIDGCQSRVWLQTFISSIRLAFVSIYRPPVQTDCWP